jgi:hypothetical protein
MKGRPALRPCRNVVHWLPTNNKGEESATERPRPIPAPRHAGTCMRSFASRCRAAANVKRWHRSSGGRLLVWAFASESSCPAQRTHAARDSSPLSPRRKRSYERHLIRPDLHQDPHGPEAGPELRAGQPGAGGEAGLAREGGDPGRPDQAHPQREAARRRQDPRELQHHGGVDHPHGAAAPGWYRRVTGRGGGNCGANCEKDANNKQEVFCLSI